MNKFIAFLLSLYVFFAVPLNVHGASVIYTFEGTVSSVNHTQSIANNAGVFEGGSVVYEWKVDYGNKGYYVWRDNATHAEETEYLEDRNDADCFFAELTVGPLYGPLGQYHPSHTDGKYAYDRKFGIWYEDINHFVLKDGGTFGLVETIFVFGDSLQNLLIGSTPVYAHQYIYDHTNYPFFPNSAMVEVDLTLTGIHHLPIPDSLSILFVGILGVIYRMRKSYMKASDMLPQKSETI